MRVFDEDYATANDECGIAVFSMEEAWRRSPEPVAFELPLLLHTQRQGTIRGKVSLARPSHGALGTKFHSSRAVDGGRNPHGRTRLQSREQVHQDPCCASLREALLLILQRSRRSRAARPARMWATRRRALAAARRRQLPTMGWRKLRRSARGSRRAV